MRFIGQHAAVFLAAAISLAVGLVAWAVNVEGRLSGGEEWRRLTGKQLERIEQLVDGIRDDIRKGCQL